MFLKLVSPQFVFERAQVAVLYSDSLSLQGLSLANGTKVGPNETFDTKLLQSDTISEVHVTRAGNITILLSDLVVKKHTDGSVHRVASLLLEGRVQPGHSSDGRVEVPVGRHALVRVAVRDAEGRPIRQCEVGITTSPATTECAVDEQGEAAFLLPPGRYSAYVVGSRLLGKPVSVPFTVEADVDECGPVDLRP